MGERSTWTVYFGLGSNLGDREANLANAIARLNSSGFDLVRASSIYETEPVGFAEQGWFLNQAVEARVADPAPFVLSSAKLIENEIGRTPAPPNGPRLIDIDLLLYEDAMIESPELILPHPRLHLRRFVLTPLAEIAPNLIHPKFGKSCAELLEELTDESIVRLYKRV